MVGFGSTYPTKVHHRGASIVSFRVDSRVIACKDGYANWYNRNQNNPNVLTGAIVGGPDENDNFADERDNYEQTEPATYNSGPLVGLLARFAGGSYKTSIPGSGKRIITFNDISSKRHAWLVVKGLTFWLVILWWPAVGSQGTVTKPIKPAPKPTPRPAPKPGPRKPPARSPSPKHVYPGECLLYKLLHMRVRS